MKVLVTGGAGFIGSHVVRALAKAGHRTAVLDNLESGRPENVPPGIRLHRADIREMAAVRRVARLEQPEAIVHLAAQINVRRSLEDPRFDAEVNVLGSLNVLEACVGSGARRFVFASSGGAMYGDRSRQPCPESAPPRPESPYGLAKLACERYAELYGRRDGLRVVNLRLANVYGPRQDPRGEAGVIAIFSSRMLDGKPTRVFGDGRQTRDYVYAEDVARAFAAALRRPPGTYNIGTGRETSVLELWRRLARLTGYEGRPRHEPAIPGELRRNALDATLARRRLRWRPQVTLEEGLRRTVEHFRSAAMSGS